jgi:hypothetical protein
LVAAVSVLVPCIPLSAQAPQLQPGARLRLTVSCEPGPECRVEGRFVQLRADTLTLAVAEAATSYSLDAIQRVEVSRHRSQTIAGVGAGFLVGAGVTFIVLHGGGSTSLCDRSANQDAIASGECLGLAALGGLAGAGLGALIGGAVRTERWQELPVEGLRVSVASRLRSTLGLAVTVLF